MAKRDLAAFSAKISTEAVFFGGPDGNTPRADAAAIVDGWKRYFDGPTPPFSWGPDTTGSRRVGDAGNDQRTGPQLEGRRHRPFQLGVAARKRRSVARRFRQRVSGVHYPIAIIV
jgi:hypothetical protein